MSAVKEAISDADVTLLVTDIFEKDFSVPEVSETAVRGCNCSRRDEAVAPMMSLKHEVGRLRGLDGTQQHHIPDLVVGSARTWLGQSLVTSRYLREEC